MLLILKHSIDCSYFISNNMYKIIVLYATPINNKPNQQQCLVDVANIMATRPLDGKKVKLHAGIVGMIYIEVNAWH
jgi:hypothetical protein